MSMSTRRESQQQQMWVQTHDPEARITKMKDGRTDLGHKSEHTIDLETQALVAIQVCGADQGDTASLPRSLLQASMNLEASLLDEAVSKAEEPPPLLSEVVTDIKDITAIRVPRC